jgi:Ca-activated chloride channel family protein
MRTVVVLLALVAAVAAPASLGAQAHEQTVYSSVIDKDGHPVGGLGVDDFVVKEDGASREVLRAGRTADPIDLAIIVDTSTAIQPYQNDFRKALTAFVTKMAGQHSANVAVLAMADRPTILADYTTSVGELTKAVQRIFAQPGSGTVFQDTVADSVKGLRQHDNPRRAIVVITTEGTDFSNVPYERTLEMLRESGAGFHALVITDRTGAATRDQPARERAIVIDRGTRTTGGRRDDLLSSMELSGALDRLAEDLTQQYKVVYGRPGSLVPPKTIDVTVKRPDVETRATLVRPKSGA